MHEMKALLDQLTQEAAKIQIQGRALKPEEIARVRAIYQALPHLQQAMALLEPPSSSNLITYKIASDVDGKLKKGARVACNFWNRFVVPKTSIVIRLGVFNSAGNTIARAYAPYSKDGVLYGRVEFNTKYLGSFKDLEIAGTIIHEVGHTLGMGWEKWMALFNAADGKFTEEAIGQLAALEPMRVELEYGPGTELSHWDEETFGRELMTGFKDDAEHVLPVTVSVMKLLGHQVAEELEKKTPLSVLMDAASQMVFSSKEQAKALDLDHFVETQVWEELPHPRTRKAR